MEITNSYSNLMKKNINNSCLYFQDKILSTFLYITNCQQINLEKKELEKDFLKMVLNMKSIIALSDIYLSFLKNTELERYEGLKHNNAFDLDEVVSSLTKDLANNFQKYGVIFLNPFRKMKSFLKE